jgi:histidinol-phosphate aminotransferase
MSQPFDPTALMRPHLRKLVPYSSARHEFQGTATVMLDANENAHGSPLGGMLHRYPDPDQHALKTEHLFIGNGSDQAIDLLLRVFCEPGRDRVIACPPTYGMYAVSAATNDVEVVQVPLGADFQLNVDAILAAANERSKLLFLCSPNNPTGNSLPTGDITRLLEGFPGIVVLDEAYVDYSAEGSSVALLEQYPDLVLLRTMSKAWGCAGLRLGMAIARPELIAILDRVKPPYNLSAPVAALALEALGKEDRMKETVTRTIASRESLARELAALPFVQYVFPSNANFLLVRFADARSVFAYLIERGIVVRDRGKEAGCEGCLRITVGTEVENKLLIDTLRTWP